MHSPVLIVLEAECTGVERREIIKGEIDEAERGRLMRRGREDVEEEREGMERDREGDRERAIQVLWGLIQKPRFLTP